MSNLSTTPRHTLAQLLTGQRAVVVDVDGSADPAAARRLFDLGFVPGAQVQMVRRAPLRDPVVFRVAGYDIALRCEQARWVTISAPGSAPGSAPVSATGAATVSAAAS